MSSSDYSHSSDLSQAVVSIRRRSDLIGYRNVLSYASALGISIFPESAVEFHPEHIGQGSRSATFRGILHEHGNDRVVAVKQPNFSFTRDKAEEEESIQHLALSSIIQEVRILADPKLKSHPNLPHVIGAFFKAESAPVGVRPCVIFELATSDFALFLRTRSHSDSDTKELLKACLEIVNGICALHAYGLVHGDIKPENILMFEREGEVVATVADLGTCGAPSQEQVIIGTQAYWPPEMHLESPLRASVNSPSRDIYSFGLVAFAAATRYRERPFPSDILEQYRIQHSEELCVERLLSRMPCESDADVAFREAVGLCVRTDPANRPTISVVAGTLKKSAGQSDNVPIMQEVARSVLTDPVQPRLNILEQMPLPEHLRSKLHAEFLVLAHDSPSVRTALTLAAFYGGVFGEQTGSSRNVVAETQWLLKAIEMGSHATLTACLGNDGLVSKTLEDYGGYILELRGPDFQSPDVDVKELQSRLEEFEKMGDADVPATILRLLTNTHPREDNDRGSQDPVTETAQVAAASAPSSATKQRDEFLKRFTLAKGFDLDPFDTGAMDLSNLRKDALHKSAYNDDLETFMALSREAHFVQGSERLHYYAALAVSNGSVRVASYLRDHFHEGPNESWDDTTHLEDSVMFGQSKVAKMYMHKDAELLPCNSERPSIFHYLIRHEDIELAKLFSSKMEAQGDFNRVLNWKPTSGDFVGNSPLRVALSSGAWKMSKLYLELGADINLQTRDGPILQSVIAPRSPHPPIELLASVLDRGADPNAVIENSPPALEWPVFTSNVLAVQELLLHGAAPVLSEDYNFCDFSKEEFQGRRTQFPVNVVDEDGQEVEQSWASAVTASELVANILDIAKDRQPGWETQMLLLVQQAPHDCLSKCWLVVGEGPSMAAIEVTVPLYV